MESQFSNTQRSIIQFICDKQNEALVDIYSNGLDPLLSPILQYIEVLGVDLTEQLSEKFIVFSTIRAKPETLFHLTPHDLTGFLILINIWSKFLMKKFPRSEIENLYNRIYIATTITPN